MLTNFPILLSLYHLDYYWLFVRCYILHILHSWPSLHTWWSQLSQSSLKQHYILILIDALWLVVGEAEVEAETLLEDWIAVLMIHQTGLNFVFICASGRSTAFPLDSGLEFNCFVYLQAMDKGIYLDFHVFCITHFKL